MDGYGVEGFIDESSNPQGVTQFGVPVFDASQYAFFGNDVVEEVELGGLDEEENDLPPVGHDDEGYQLGRAEGDDFGSLSEIDDLNRTFSKLNEVVSGSIKPGSIGDRESKGGSSAFEWAQEADVHNWIDQQAFDGESTYDSERWSSHSSAGQFFESKTLYGTSSYPAQQQPLHHQYSSEPILVPKSSFTSFPPPVEGHLQASLNNPKHPGGEQMQLSSPNFSPLNSQNHLTASHHAMQYSRNFTQGMPSGLPLHNRIQNQFLTQSISYPGDHSSFPNNLMPQQFPCQNGLIPPHLQQQQPQQPGLRHPLQSPSDPLPGLQSQLFNHQMSPPYRMMNNCEILGLGDLSDQRTKQMLIDRLGPRYSQLGGDDIGGQRNDRAWPRFRSKYMTAGELENILRTQLAATQSNDPYIDDYYHQACLAKKSAGAKLIHHFCPNNLRDGTARTRTDAEPHPFLQVDALGRVSFSSIRRPRPLVEVDPPISSATGCNDEKMSEKPLAQEPMLAVRVTIEDGFCLLLDVDDVDRFLQFNQLPGRGDQLNRRRQVLLEGLASSLQLVDPLGKNGHSLNMVVRDDLIFLRIVSLPKGRKLLAQYLQLLFPGSEQTRVVCMAIFRHLRFLFGGLPSDLGVSETTTNLGQTLSLCIGKMELNALAACLASVVCSAEHPPLRPIGSPAGDGASVVLKSLLERATELLRDPHATANCSIPNRTFWQASFDAFFGLLTEYCFNKYDTVMQSLLTQAPPGVAVSVSDAAKAINREMPVELLRASLPHTSEQQRKVLLDFAQRSMPVTGIDGQA